MNAGSSSSRLDSAVATAILGIDTLWGGDVMNPSGTGRFIADSWFSDAPLPEAYAHESAVPVRGTGGVSAPEPDRAAIDAYLAAVDVRGAIATVAAEANAQPALRRSYLESLALCLEVMWDLAMEILGRGNSVSYERCVSASTGRPPAPSNPEAKRTRLAELLSNAGHPSGNPAEMLAAVDAWRSQRQVPGPSISSLGAAYIAHFDALVFEHLMPYLPGEIQGIPRANVRFLPIRDAWFSGSMNYLGRARRPDGSPEYDAAYEINASLQISVPEFQQLVSHEVVPGHVTTFAFLQALYVRGLLGFESTVLTMNTRSATLFEGIANNAILIAYGVGSVDELPHEDLQAGVLLALLQDDAKNQASWLTWHEGWDAAAVAQVLRRDFLVSEERARKLSGAWGRHPLLGRMYLPAYKSGTEAVAELRHKYAPGSILPALYGCRGLVDVTTVEQAIA